MDTIRIDNRNTKMIAHRGISGLEKENTLAAFIAAGNRNYYGIETDIHVTKDGAFAVIHDDNTLRVSGIDMIVEETDLSVLREIRLFDLDGKTKRNDLVIPVLSEYLLTCKKYGKEAVLELKNHFDPEDIKRVIEECRTLDVLDTVTFISFDAENMINLRKFLPDQSLQFLTEEYSKELIPFLKDHRLDVDIHYTALSESAVRAFHENGIRINCWTVNTKEEAEALIALGVDMITSNILQGIR